MTEKGAVGMRSFRDILFVGRGAEDETDALEQALSLARHNGAKLTALVVGPDVPDAIAPYRETLVEALERDMRQAIEAVRDAIGLGPDDVPVTVEVRCGSAPVVHIIQRVIRDGHDLVVKKADSGDGQTGFKAVDMHLLRKCPCPVWLCRRIARSREEMRVGVAVDPESREAAGHDLSLRLLTLARSLADTCSGELEIIACWEFEYEGFLRHSPWARVPEDEVQGAVTGAQEAHRSALSALVEASGIGGAYRIHHERGRPGDAVPTRVDELALDILVMGTVARTGLPGFLIGNTAEDIVQRIRCSLLAVKPPGFVSPVKPY